MTNFPNSPVAGDFYNHPNGSVYTFDGIAWSVVRASESTLQVLVNRIASLEAQLSQNFLILE